MIAIPPGRFTIGTTEGTGKQPLGDHPQPMATIARGLSIGRYEVSKAQFAYFVAESGYTPGNGCFVWSGRYSRDPSKNWRDPGFKQSDNEPVVCVNWNDANAYTQWLSKKTGHTYRLPNEIEWEYAARAGLRTERPWEDNEFEACRYANVGDAAAKRELPNAAMWVFHTCDDGKAYTAPVGNYLPNAFGLYDTLGNVWEWMDDCLDAEISATSPDQPQPKPSGLCSQRLLRGGSWVDSPSFVSYDFRFRIGANDRDFYMGFRVARIDQ